MIHKFIRAILICLISIALPWHAGATEILNAGADGVAIDGFDTVAYFTENKPVKGLEKFSKAYKGHEWHFASAANRDAFAADPKRYAPQYNGFCAIAVSEGAAAEVDFINGWTIQQDRLYMNWSASVKETFLNELDERIAASRRLWPELQVEMKYGIRQIARHKDFPYLGIVHPQQEPN